MSLKKPLKIGQASLEYVILFAVISTIVFTQLAGYTSTGGFFDRCMKKFFYAASASMAQ